MRLSISLLSAAAIASCILLDTRAAQAQHWRCTDVLGGLECDDGLVNDIEAIITRDWPSSTTLVMPPLPYVCNRQPGPRPVAPDPGEPAVLANPSEPGPSFVSELPWSIQISPGDLRSFLIGNHTASADVIGTFRVSGTDIVPASWASTAINYLFNEGTSEVPDPRGTTGVARLGSISFSTPAGSFWNASMRIEFDLVDGNWDCIVGQGDRSVRGSGTTVRINFPLRWTPVADVLATRIRDRFAAAAQIAVFGSSPLWDGGGSPAFQQGEPSQDSVPADEP